MIIKNCNNNRMFNRRLALISIIFALFGGVVVRPAISGEPEVVDRIIAIVNDEIITLSEVNAIYQPQVERIKSMGYSLREERKRLFRVREEIIMGLINQKLTEQEIEKKNLKVSEEEIDKTIERFKEDKGLTDEDLEPYLAERNLNREEFRDYIKNSLLKSQLLSYEVRSKIVVTQEDIKAYYNSHSGDYGVEKVFHLGNLAMKVPASADEKTRQTMSEEMEKISAALKEGQSLQTIIEEYANSSYPLAGGDLGKFKIGELSPQLQGAIADKKAGEFTDVMETDFGYQIIFVKDISELEEKSLEKAYAEIRDKLRNEKLDEKYREWLEALKERSHIKIIK